MVTFTSLPDGTLLNLNAVAYVGLTHLPDGTDVVPGLHVVLFPLADGDSGPNCLHRQLEGKAAGEFLAALHKAGINVKCLREHLSSKKLAKAIKNSFQVPPKTHK